MYARPQSTEPSWSKSSRGGPLPPRVTGHSLRPRIRFRMKFRRQGAMGEREARTQGAFVEALRTQLRTTHRAVQRGLDGRGFILKRVLRIGPRKEVEDEAGAAP